MYLLQILVLIITGITTLLQMKHHPIILGWNNDTNSYVQHYSILVLIITGITTLIQMKHDPITMQLQNNTYYLYFFRFINGMIEFDRKLTPFSTRLLSKQRSFSKRQWDIVLISFFLFYVVYTLLHCYMRPTKSIDIHTLAFILFVPPFLLDYVITSSLCYFLHNLHTRFWTLNDLWKCLPAELAVDHNQWTHIEIVLFMEKIRLLNSELCELLKKFTIGFGPLLLAFFTFSFSCLLIGSFIMVTRFHILVSSERSAAEAWRQIFNVIFNFQIFIFMVSIIVYVSLIEKQIKMFMNQMSFSGLDRITAFGFFDVNLNLVTSLCYFLHNLHARLWTLNDLWKCLPAELAVDHDQWTHIEIVFFMEKTRLLHSELCELLNKFTIGFGPLLLAFFSFSFSCLLIGSFIMVTRFHILVSGEHSSAEVWEQIFNVTDHIQIVIFMMSIIVYVSFIEEQVTNEDNIISTIIQNFQLTYGRQKTNQNVYESNVSFWIGPNYSFWIFRCKFKSRYVNSCTNYYWNNDFSTDVT
ncbi:hypothetical protein AGLY_004840 [Aphis glycines]|uniref:Gustatory receptor n=1 Tax=Aphis glycines TaxID=307491 RepID=A0A6G0TV17_APHGL|nr:hypothetical protein AGLY_004840 [Aphis glycines]